MRIANFVKSFIVLILILCFSSEGWSLIWHMDLDEINNYSCVYDDGYSVENQCSEMSKYNTAAFLSYVIYEGLSNFNISSNFFYGKYKYATLEDYENDPATGLVAGLFSTNDNRFFIVFGGTDSSTTNDIFVDMNLLNNYYEPLHIKQAIEFAEKSLQEIIKLPGGEQNLHNTFVVGHSLGGGLAQLVALSKGVKAVTFNTAPAPVTAITKKYLADDYLKNEAQILNIMAINDPLTTVLEQIETIELYGHDLLDRPTRYNSYYEGMESLYSSIQTKYSFINKIIDGVDVIYQINPTSPFEKVKNIFDTPESQANYSSINDAIKKLSSGDEDISKAIFFELIRLLKSSDLEEMIPLLKQFYGIPKNQRMTKLIYGKRLLLSNETNHSMLFLINGAFQGINDFFLDELLLPDQTVFKDVKKNSSFFIPITILEKEKVISGRNKDYFDVDGKITRAEFYAIINKYIFQYDYNEILADINEGGYINGIYIPISWQKAHASYLRSYFKNKWHYNTPDNLNYESADNNDELVFLNMYINRDEVSKILYSIIRSEISDYISEIQYPVRCNDWTQESLLLKRIDIINGYPDDGCFKPDAYISRGEASAILVKVKQYLDIH